MGHIIYKAFYHINWCNFLFHQQYASEQQWIFKRLKFLFKKQEKKQTYLDSHEFPCQQHFCVRISNVWGLYLNIPSEATEASRHIFMIHYQHFSISLYSTLPEFEHCTLRNLHDSTTLVWPVLEVSFDNQVMLFSWDQVLFFQNLSTWARKLSSLKL